MMWYLVTKNRCVCVCVWLSSAFTTGPVGFCLKKKQRKIGRNCFFFWHAVSMENGTHIIPPKKPCWTVNEPFQRGPPQLQLSLNRPTSDLPRGLMVNSMSVGKGLIFFPTWHIPRGERYDLVLCYHMLLCDLQSFIPSYHIYYMKFHYIV